jgi:putative spermidine/putrescine transport system ATP-binding protein
VSAANGEKPGTQRPIEAGFIRIRNVSKRFGDFTAVDDVTLDIGKGELFSILGGSGCGKTTLLRILAGFEAPSAGTIEIDGHDVTRQPPYERPVNMMFQSYALFPHMNVERNIGYGLVKDGVSKTEIARRVDEMLALVQLGDFRRRRPTQLSGGQRQRVALARALVNEPEVLLLDEPLGALDLKLREQLQIELKQIQREVGITFVYVTHDQDEALTMSDRIAVFNEGSIEQVGDPEAVYERPGNTFVAGFVGISNVVERGGRRFTVRPEKVRLLMNGEPAEGLVVEEGTISDVSYAGMVTRFRVELAQGGSIQLARQNAETTSRADEEGLRGRQVKVGWRREHTVAVAGGGESVEQATHQQEEMDR